MKHVAYTCISYVLNMVIRLPCILCILVILYLYRLLSEVYVPNTTAELFYLQLHSVFENVRDVYKVNFIPFDCLQVSTEIHMCLFISLVAASI